MERESLHKYQEASATHIIDNPAAALFAEIGMGKTISTLTAIQDMQQFPVLIVAPLFVAHTVWAQEALKWGHTRYLSFSRVLGTATQRLRALEECSDVYIINRENLPWLAKQESLPPFRVIVLDELSGYRKPGGARVKAVHKLRNRFKPRMIGLTGTPAPNGLLGLFSQIKCLDGGKALGTNFENFKKKHFIAEDYMEYDWQPRDGTEAFMKNSISKMSMSLQASDYLELPPRMDNPFEIILPDDMMDTYHQFERTSVLKPADDGGEPIAAVNNAVLCGKLTQLASGAVYTDPEGESEVEYYKYHAEKARVMQDILDDMQGEPVLIAYWYQHSRDAIIEKLGEVPEVSIDNIDAWNAGKIPVMLIHPASAGHGIQLQFGGHQIMWYDMIFDLELYEQTIGRLDRQGQTKPVFNHLLMAYGTVDATIYQALKTKTDVQTALMNDLKRKQ